MNRTCIQCANKFTVRAEDLEFYDKISPVFADKKISVPPPTHCPKCRVQRRHAWRNEFCLYNRKCDLCSSPIVSIYSEDKPFTVYCNNCWWSDKWNPLDYGIDYNESEPFFKQFQKLQEKVPRMAIWNDSCENSEYTNHSSHLKNSYLSTCAIYSENVYYSRWLTKCKDLCDCYEIVNSELCYETSYSDGAYRIIEGYFADSHDGTFVYDCKGCANCFMSWNLRHKKYCIENKQYSKEQYEKIMKEINLGSYEQYRKYKEQFLEIIKNKGIKQSTKVVMCENSDGELLYKCKNVHDSYGSVGCQDCCYCHEGLDLTDCYDVCETANCQLQYETSGCDDGNTVIASSRSPNLESSYYTEGCSNGSHLFGCIGVNRKNYCILNKQYSKKEFEKLAAKIAEDMKKNNEWGEFFPMGTSPFAYNETTAYEDFPITREEAEKNGWQWKIESKKQYLPQTFQIPDDIKDVQDSITKEILACTECGKNYKIVLPEIKFYRKLNVPLPRKCPSCRRKDRKKLRPPLFGISPATCQKCGNATATSPNPDYPGITYCEKCYLASVY